MKRTIKVIGLWATTHSFLHHKAMSCRKIAPYHTLKFGNNRKKQYFCNRNYKNTAL